VYLGKWGSSGTGNGQFDTPTGVATDPGGNVYVSDESLMRVQKFTGSGTYICEWGLYGNGNGEFRGPAAMAADAAGNVYVADSNNHRIQMFGGTVTPAQATTWGRLKALYR
jgi:DNA-binding beta-propeller fold protein YncE